MIAERCEEMAPPSARETSDQPEILAGFAAGNWWKKKDMKKGVRPSLSGA